MTENEKILRNFEVLWVKWGAETNDHIEKGGIDKIYKTRARMQRELREVIEQSYDEVEGKD